MLHALVDDGNFFQLLSANATGGLLLHFLLLFVPTLGTVRRTPRRTSLTGRNVTENKTIGRDSRVNPTEDVTTPDVTTSLLSSSQRE